ncbi:hypothetical protein B9Z65_1508 [Elsinoe australis]|uniref:Apple domain-containing protein n=1 Tax=Elsinoe australis TaxID=40998 RepID=A0A2P7YG32_9PEZI|nr:hypothetical protein B9Z65_1508 [Elsinoe australis]
MLTNALLVSALTGLSLAGPVAKAAKKRADVCGTKGYDRGKGNYSYDNSGKYSTYAACSARCLADVKCKSFGFGGKECLLFNIALNGNFDADKNSKDTYYDRGCISASATTSAAPKTTTTTTSKTTTKAPITTSKTSLPSATPPTTTAIVVTTTPSTPTSTGVAIPASCTNVPPTVSITSFSWFNSTHNLDCADQSSNPPNAQVCWNGATNTLCAAGSDGCTCTGYCLTGLPTAAYQPLGYGPPDTININIEGLNSDRTCSAANPQSIRRNELGQGHFDCGSAADYIGFYGDSNKDAGNVGSVYYNAYTNTCNGAAPRYEGSFPLICSRDAGNNATCTAALPVVLTLASL